MINSKNVATIALLVLSTIIANVPNHCQSSLSRYCDLLLPANDENNDKVVNRNQATERYEYLKTNTIPFLIRVLYDSSMEAEFPEQHVRHDYIRNLIYSAQLILEQPELYEHIKLNIIVLSVEKMDRDFGDSVTPYDMVAMTDQINLQTNNNKSDFTVILFYKVYSDSLGRAALSSFCHPSRTNRPRGIIVSAHALNSGLILAHEIGHTLSMIHENNTFPPGCIPSRMKNSMMWQSGGQGNWSECSVQLAKDHLISDKIYNCIQNETRLSWAKPMDDFDFRRNSSGRRPYPGERFSLDEQCQLSSDKIARSLPIEDHNNCARLECIVDGHQFSFDQPALYGSDCVSRKWRGKCENQVCSRGELT